MLLTCASTHTLCFQGVFGHAYTGLRQSLVDAADKAKAAAAAKGAHWRILRELAILILVLCSYFSAACGVLCPLQNWTITEAVYFATATASTVG